MTRRTMAALLLVAVVGAAAVGGARWLRSDDREVTTVSGEAYDCYREGLANNTRFRLEQAYDCFEKAVKLDPDFAVGHMRLALAARELGRTETYEQHLALAIEKRDQVTEIERLWIERLQAVTGGDHAKGKEIYAQMEALYPDHRWVLRLEAEFAKLNGEFEEALVAYDRILEQDPEAVDIHNLKGYLYLAQGDYEEAVQSLQRYAFYAPDQANPHDSLGEAYMSMGRFEESIQEFTLALEIDPTFVWSGVHLSEVLAITGQFEKARHILGIVKPVFQERGWDNWLVTQGMKIDYLAEDWDALLQEAESRLPVDPDTFEMRDVEYAMWLNYTRTIAYLERGDVENAEIAVQGVIDLVEKLRKEGSAYRNMDPIIDLNRTFIESRFARAQGEPAFGIEPLRKAIAASKLSPHELSFSRRELVEALIEAERYDEAIAEADVMLATIPTEPELNLLSARAHLQIGRQQEALAHLQLYFEVMRFADDGHPRVAEAKRLYDRVVPRS